MQVFWLQTSSLFGDLRIPEPTPAEGIPNLGEATSEALLALATQVRPPFLQTSLFWLENPLVWLRTLTMLNLCRVLEQLVGHVTTR